MIQKKKRPSEWQISEKMPERTDRLLQVDRKPITTVITTGYDKSKQKSRQTSLGAVS